MEDLPTTEEEVHPSEGDRVPTLLQLPYQEVESEAEAPNRTSFIRWKTSARDIEIREQESLNLNKVFSAVQGEQ